MNDRSFEVSGFRVAPAFADDAADLAAFAAASFTDTFGFNYPPEDLAAFLADACSVEATARILADPTRLVRIARDAGGAVAGFVEAGAMSLPFEGAEPDAPELKRLYVAPAAKGTGLARALTEMVIDAARARGAPGLYLGVWSRNPRAIHFYAKLGFEAVGAYGFKVGATIDDELILRLPLA